MTTLVDHGIIPPEGMVPLSEKTMPVCEMAQFPEHLAYTRSSVDVSKFQTKLRNLPISFWEDENQTGNVRMKRPAHDAWGVKKIVFTFCDDYMLKVVDLPFSKMPEWRDLLLPIYHSIGIEENQVVRCLIANMPPGMKIPVHHDTGYWVKHCHRCHAALETGNEVSFNVGPTVDSMHKVCFSIGKVVELNNQSKHEVINGMNSHRIHLIFDYVEKDFFKTHPRTKRMLLKPSDVLVQTRRSVDLQSDYGKTQVPRFIIIGAQKCGTTSVYEYLMQHGLAAKGSRRETHFFDWRWPEKLSKDVVLSESDRRAAFDEYMTYYPYEGLKKNPSCFTGESTPSYLLHRYILI